MLEVDCPLSALNFFDSAIQSCSGHPHIFGYLGRWLAGLDEFGCGTDLGFGEGGPPATEVSSGGAAFVHGVGDAFSFDFQFHLGECGHDGEDHGTHGRFGVHVAAAQVQYPQSDISFA